MNCKIKAGFLISYDYKYIYHSLPLIYKYVDEIYLAIDKDRLTWAGNTIEIEASFFDFIKKTDTENKIHIYEDNFYRPELTTMQNDTRERNMLSKKMGTGCWQMQIDADEYVINIKAIKALLSKYAYLLTNAEKTPVSLVASLVPLYKKTANGYIYVNNREPMPIICNLPGKHTFARNTDLYKVKTNIVLIHESWSRTEEEIKKKITNWSHNTDFNAEKYFNDWLAVNESNYMHYKNFHPVYPADWKSLEFIACTDIQDFINKYTNQQQAIIRKVDRLSLKMRLKLFFKYL